MHSVTDLEAASPKFKHNIPTVCDARDNAAVVVLNNQQRGQSETKDVADVWLCSLCGVSPQTRPYLLQCFG